MYYSIIREIIESIMYGVFEKYATKIYIFFKIFYLTNLA
jgi:hypothetical protein